MPDESPGAAVAQSPAPTSAPPSAAPPSAERAAVEARDFDAFDREQVAQQHARATGREAETAPAQPVSKRQQQLLNYERRVQDGAARLAELEGRTRAVESEGAAGAEAPPAPPSRQQVINDYERRVFEQERRIRELESRLPARGAAPPPPPETVKDRVKRFLALPDAPKLDDFDSYPEYTAAQALFLREKRDEEQAVVVQQRATQQAQHEAMVARDQAFRERLTAAKTADPTFVDVLSPEAKNLGGIDHAIRTGQQPGPVHIIGELVYDSPHAVAFLKHISAHPDALGALVTLPEALQRLPPPRTPDELQRRVRAHIDHMVTEFRRLEGRLAYEASLAGASDTARSATPSPQPTSVSTAPPPPPTLGKAGQTTDPQRAALARRDFNSWHQQETARLAAERQGRAS